MSEVPTDRAVANGQVNFLKRAVLTVNGLSGQEAADLAAIKAPVRQSIFTLLSKVHAWNNPVSGFELTEKIAICVKKMTGEKTMVLALELDLEQSELGRHSREAYVRKLYTAFMETIEQDSATGSELSKKIKQCNRVMKFHTFWKRFKLYRRFVRAASIAEGVRPSQALHSCGVLGRSLVKSIDSLNDLVCRLESSPKQPEMFEKIMDESFEQDYGDCDRHQFDTLLETHRDAFLDSEEEYTVDADEVFDICRRVVKKETRARKKHRKLSRPQRARSFPQPKKPKASDPATDVQNTDVDTELPQLKEDIIEPLVEPPSLFDSSQCVVPHGEWIVFEVPYRIDEEGCISVPNIVHDKVNYLPDGTTSFDIAMVLLIKIDSEMFYCMEGLTDTHHGQVDKAGKATILERCNFLNIPCTVIGNTGRLCGMMGIHVAHLNTSFYQRFFDDLKFDPHRIMSYIKKRNCSKDHDRGTIQITLGVSTLNHEHHKKTPEEISQRLLDAPDWSGTEEDFRQLGPLICHVLDRIQDSVDTIYKGDQKLMTNEMRYELFGERLNKKLGCQRNRFEAVTLAFFYVCPRTGTLLRHLDQNNDHRPGYNVTGVWRCCFKDSSIILENGQEAMVCMSVIAYTRKHAGNYSERTATYVAATLSWIDEQLTRPQYAKAAKFHELNLGVVKFQREPVWVQGNPEDIRCYVTGQYFDPCSFLSAMAWCITRLRVYFSLSQIQVVEMVHLCSCMSSHLPLVWLTNKWLQQPSNYLKEALGEHGSISKLAHDDTCCMADRASMLGGRFARHQNCLRHQPGGRGIKHTHFKNREGEPTATSEFDHESLQEHRKQMFQLDQIIVQVSDPMTEYSGKQAFVDLQKLDGIGDLNVLKVLPLAALVGLFDVKRCFKDVLYGELPNKPHRKALEGMGCDQPKLQQKLAEGLNEKYGQPRSWFFHADHALCHGYGGNDNRKDVFYPNQLLYRFVEMEFNETETAESYMVVGIQERKVGGGWVPCCTHVWETTTTETGAEMEE